MRGAHVLLALAFLLGVHFGLGFRGGGSGSGLTLVRAVRGMPSRVARVLRRRGR